MEVNRWEDIRGVVAVAAVVEGRMGLITTHTEDYNFGSKVDLPGIKVPATATEALRALYVIGFADDNRDTPIIEPMPGYDFTMFQGWNTDDSDNVPITGTTIHLTHPGNNNVPQTVPAGDKCLAYAGGVFTVPSGHFVYSADIETPDAALEVLNTADDTAASAGKLAFTSVAANAVARTVSYDSTTGALTFRTALP